MTFHVGSMLYCQSLAYVGSGEVLKIRKDGRLVIETPMGRTRKVKPSDCRPIQPSPLHPFPLPKLERPANTEGAELVAAPKPDEPIRNPGYLRWLRTQPCAKCGSGPPSEASHHPREGHGRMGKKTDDTRAIALCRHCHDRHHRRPLPREWVEEQVCEHLRRWVKEMGE